MAKGVINIKIKNKHGTIKERISSYEFKDTYLTFIDKILQNK